MATCGVPHALCRLCSHDSCVHCRIQTPGGILPIAKPHPDQKHGYDTCWCSEIERVMPIAWRYALRTDNLAYPKKVILHLITLNLLILRTLFFNGIYMSITHLLSHRLHTLKTYTMVFQIGCKWNSIQKGPNCRNALYSTSPLRCKPTIIA